MTPILGSQDATNRDAATDAFSSRRFLEDGSKVRYLKKTGEVID